MCGPALMDDYGMADRVPPWTGPPLEFLITRVKNILDFKTRGVLARFSFFRLLQQPVMPMISIHISARGKRTATTGAKPNKDS